MRPYFIKFKPETDTDKLMVIYAGNHQLAWDLAHSQYGKAIQTIYTEQEVANLPDTLNCKENWIPFGSPIRYTYTGCDGSTNVFTYGNSHSVTLEPITHWFKVAKPNPVDKDFPTQLGAMYEEVVESISVIKQLSEDTDLQNQAVKAYLELKALSQLLYKAKKLELNQEQKVEMLDALVDITVTTTGSAYFMDSEWDKALTEVNQSNFSKFENGKPILNQDGKIMKGNSYFKPNLERFV